MRPKYEHKATNQAICAVNLCTRLFYTRKTRCDVFYARFERADKVSVKFARSATMGLQSHHMMHSRFVCYRCFKVNRVMAGYGICLMCSGKARYEDDDIYSHNDDDGYYDDDDYDTEDFCPVCGNYEICDEQHHIEHDLSYNLLHEQLSEATSFCCGERLYHSHHNMPDETVCERYATARCIKCSGVHTILHDQYYSIIAIINGGLSSWEAHHRNLPVVINDDEIPF
jgi:hypothetical protein